MKIDAHQHFWNVDNLEYPVLNKNRPHIYRNIEPPELAPLLQKMGMNKTVVVQAMDVCEETEYMLELAGKYEWIAGVVGWVPLHKPDEANIHLRKFSENPKFKGVRHLIMTESDPEWMIQGNVMEGLRVLGSYQLSFDIPAVFPNHLVHIPVVAKNVPHLRIVIDHLAKPPIREKQMEPWASQLKEAASHPNVYAKISGLNTAADWDTWAAEDIKPYIDVAFDVFGSERLMYGSDWPICNLSDDYERVWVETNKALQGRSQEERDYVFGRTAQQFYGL